MEVIVKWLIFGFMGGFLAGMAFTIYNATPSTPMMETGTVLYNCDGVSQECRFTWKKECK